MIAGRVFGYIAKAGIGFSVILMVNGGNGRLIREIGSQNEFSRNLRTPPA